MAGGRISCRLRSDVELVRTLMGGRDDETVINSSGDSGEERDYVRGLAQRATDPEFKERKAKGPWAVSQMSV